MGRRSKGEIGERGDKRRERGKEGEGEIGREGRKREGKNTYIVHVCSFIAY